MCNMFGNTTWALLVLGAATLSFTACNRRADSPLLHATQGVEPLASATPATPMNAVVEIQPTVVAAGADSPVVTARNLMGEHGDGSGNVSLDLRYDPSTEISLRGPVLGKRFVRLEGGHTAEIVELMPSDNFVDVMIGTTEYFFDHSINVGITDEIMVRGSVLRLDGRDMLLARELTWRGSTYTMRDDAGRPVWRKGQSSSPATVSTGNQRAAWRWW